mmetsp:Transcript_17688/g.57908  ORF Transcript_17688/g.57908 Transcript_17688/m.57908 type:complete len:205 (-) Transcript_17688:1139-1753(-)
MAVVAAPSRMAFQAADAGTQGTVLVNALLSLASPRSRTAASVFLCPAPSSRIRAVTTRSSICVASTALPAAPSVRASSCCALSALSWFSPSSSAHSRATARCSAAASSSRPCLRSPVPRIFSQCSSCRSPPSRAASASARLSPAKGAARCSKQVRRPATPADTLVSSPRSIMSSPRIFLARSRCLDEARSSPLMALSRLMASAS